MLSTASRTAVTRPSLAANGVISRKFSGYSGMYVDDSDLVKKKDDWVIEETNFCFGRIGPPRYAETDDMARRTKRLYDQQRVRMHTRLRDGTVIPYTGINLADICDRPLPAHTFNEQPLVKYTWDTVYDAAFDPEPVKPIKPWTKVGPGANNPDGQIATSAAHAAKLADQAWYASGEKAGPIPANADMSPPIEDNWELWVKKNRIDIDLNKYEIPEITKELIEKRKAMPPVEQPHLIPGKKVVSDGVLTTPEKKLGFARGFQKAVTELGKSEGSLYERTLKAVQAYEDDTTGVSSGSGPIAGMARGRLNKQIKTNSTNFAAQRLKTLSGYKTPEYWDPPHGSEGPGWKIPEAYAPKAELPPKTEAKAETKKADVKEEKPKAEAKEKK